MMTALAKMISFVFHPLFGVSYILLLILAVNPYLFGVNQWSDQVPLIILLVFSTVLIPGLSVVMMKALGLVQTLELEDKTDRIGPYIITGIFYLWMVVNFRNNPNIPSLFASFMLGATIALFLAFFINLFSKISAHTVGMGGLVAMIGILLSIYSYSDIHLDLGGLGMVEISLSFVFLAAIFIAGLVGTARLWLGAHDMQDLVGGYMVGAAGQLIALRFFIV
ncbi:MAG: hypothetical protein AAGH79_03545 [Bacteroidota bacterium]